MKHLDPKVFPSVVAARINELRVAKGLSMEQLAKAANLTTAEVRAIQEDHEQVHVELIDRVANALQIHPAVLVMCPGDDPIAHLLEPYRELSKEDFRRIARELEARGFRRSGGGSA